MRVAVLADIHGNLPALEAVLRDVEDAGVDAAVLCGDLADGPMPAQTLDAWNSSASAPSRSGATPIAAWRTRSMAALRPAAWPPMLRRSTLPGAQDGSAKLTGTGWPACR